MLMCIMNSANKTTLETFAWEYHRASNKEMTVILQNNIEKIRNVMEVQVACRAV